MQRLPYPIEPAFNSFIDSRPDMCFIDGDVPSSKNSKNIARRKDSGKPFVIGSQAVQKYKKNYAWLYVRDREKIRKAIASYPAQLGIHFFRKTRSTYDHHNMVQLVADMLVKFEHIPDDDIQHMLIFPMQYNGEWSTHMKDRPGVLIQVLNHEKN